MEISPSDVLPNPQGFRDSVWASVAMLAAAAAVSWGMARYKNAPPFWQWVAFSVMEGLTGIAAAAAVLRFGPAASLWGLVALLFPVVILLFLDNRHLRANAAAQRHRRPSPAVVPHARDGAAPTETAPVRTVMSHEELSARAGDRVLVPPSVTPEYLWEQFAGKTDTQAQRAIAVYVDHWMRIAGDLGDFSRGKYVTFKSGRFPGIFTDVLMTFPEGPSRAKLEMMSIGEPIEVLGKIVRVTRSQIELDDCELL